MSDIKWIKIVTDIFEDEKILLINDMPKRDTVIVIWLKLLCLAGKQNNGGIFMLNEKTPYTDKMLATIFKRSIKDLKYSLKIFENFGMIEINQGTISLPKWNKHQSFDIADNRREYMRNYMADKRKRKSEPTHDVSNVLTDVNSNGVNTMLTVSTVEKEEEKELKYISSGGGGIIYNNNIAAANTNVNTTPPPTAKKSYGTYGNVMLTDSELEGLKKDFPDIDERIERLSQYMHDKGTQYRDHNFRIRQWAKTDFPARQEMTVPKDTGSFDTAEFAKAAIDRSMQTITKRTINNDEKKE